jgi:hypothetical protein
MVRGQAAAFQATPLMSHIPLFAMMQSLMQLQNFIRLLGPLRLDAGAPILVTQAE